ncbi:MAG: phosphoribosylaminoimidazolesuccinocarboxamide synthase [Puniceicoccaceae bacterium]|nr:MAG: phosphoribosylaminoimidazolesuccinocarboxamide synthase [Puniceicoccaceae bacterium]
MSPDSLPSGILDRPCPALPQALPRIASGKVREIFDLGDHLLLLATDRISAFDVILPTPIPGKGVCLTQISRAWFAFTRGLFRNHLDAPAEEGIFEALRLSPALAFRSMVVRKLTPLPVECVVRGYLAGSGWAAYRREGALWGQALPAGLRQADRLPEPLFTPTTKAAAGHDEPLSLQRARAILGTQDFEEVRAASLRLFAAASALAARAGLILADTKFEFGRGEDGSLWLIDEILTPDSSRYWEAKLWQPGQTPPSFDKQYVRDYLSSLSWDKTPPGPELPREVVAGTRERYVAVWRRLAAAMEEGAEETVLPG